MAQQKKKKSVAYRLLAGIVRFFYKKPEFTGTENIPDEPSMIISNHAQVHGPLISELYFPKKKKIWCIGQMMKLKEVPDYAYQDFWSFKSKFTRPFYRLLSYIIAPLSVFLFNHADAIGVYKDARILTTFRETVNALESGEHVVIMPERQTEYNEIVNDFQDKFVDVAKLYYKKRGKAVSFVPMYVAPKLKKIVFGKPITFDPNMETDEQRRMICGYLKEQITALAKELPRHKVVPYANIKKKNYPYSK